MGRYELMNHNATKEQRMKKAFIRKGGIALAGILAATFLASCTAEDVPNPDDIAAPATTAPAPEIQTDVVEAREFESYDKDWDIPAGHLVTAWNSDPTGELSFDAELLLGGYTLAQGVTLPDPDAEQIDFTAEDVGLEDAPLAEPRWTFSTDGGELEVHSIIAPDGSLVEWQENVDAESFHSFEVVEGELHVGFREVDALGNATTSTAVVNHVTGAIERDVPEGNHLVYGEEITIDVSHIPWEDRAYAYEGLDLNDPDTRSSVTKKVDLLTADPGRAFAWRLEDRRRIEPVTVDSNEARLIVDHVPRGACTFVVSMELYSCGETNYYDPSTAESLGQLTRDRDTGVLSWSDGNGEEIWSVTARGARIMDANGEQIALRVNENDQIVILDASNGEIVATLDGSTPAAEGTTIAFTEGFLTGKGSIAFPVEYDRGLEVWYFGY